MRVGGCTFSAFTAIWKQLVSGPSETFMSGALCRPNPVARLHQRQCSLVAPCDKHSPLFPLGPLRQQSLRCMPVTPRSRRAERVRPHRVPFRRAGRAPCSAIGAEAAPCPRNDTPMSVLTVSASIPVVGTGLGRPSRTPPAGLSQVESGKVSFSNGIRQRVCGRGKGDYGNANCGRRRRTFVGLSDTIPTSSPNN